MSVRRTLLALIAGFVLAPSARGQDLTPQQPVATLPATINVFLDCGNFHCDFDFFRTEIPFVNWVRDRAVADVHILGTSQGTGGGGDEYVFNFIGLRGFAQTVDTLKYVGSVDATSDILRRGQVRAIKTGLVPFLARTALGNRLQITLLPAAANAPAAAPLRDPWHGWVVQLSANSFTNGEKSYKFLNGYFDAQVSRITENWKSVIGGDFSYDDQKSTVELGNNAGTADTTYVTIKRNWQSYGSQFKSLGDHWSVGATASLGSQTYSNQSKYGRAKAAVEYNLFPYKESTRRQLRAQYGVGLAHYQYIDTTIHFKIRETRPIHYAAVAMSARQPWGNLSGNISHNALLDDPSQRSTRLHGNANIRVLKGLSFYVGGQYSWIHDQLYLRKGQASTATVLLRQQQLKTSYSYFGNFGLSYTFGSIFNNVVFPRFGGNSTF
ncbi:MAG: hypothetical protein ABIR92_03030 [Gemmatimonadaceae bacterium]